MDFGDRYHTWLAESVSSYPSASVRAELTLAFRICLMFAGESYLSASAFFEAPTTRRLVLEHRPFCEAGLVYLTAKDGTLAEHFSRKATKHYGDGSPADLQRAYKRLDRSPVLYRSFAIDTSGHIKRRWSAQLHEGLPRHLLDNAVSGGPFHGIEDAWQRVPELVGERALVLPHVQTAFSQLGVASPSPVLLMSVLEPGYSDAHSTALAAHRLGELLFLRPPWESSSQAGMIPFRGLVHMLRALGLLPALARVPADQLLDIRLGRDWTALAPIILGATQGGEMNEEARRAAKDVAAAATGRTSAIPPRRYEANLAVVVALPEEWSAVTLAFGATELHAVAGDPNRYAAAEIAADTSLLRVVITLLPRMGTNSASAAATNLLRSFPGVNDVIFCGIACGCPDPHNPGKHVRLGDILVSDVRGIIQTDMQSVRGSRRNKIRSAEPPPSRRLLNGVRLLTADALTGKRPWEEAIDVLSSEYPVFRRPPPSTDRIVDDQGTAVRHPHDPERRAGYPRVFCGPIGSSNSLIRDAALRTRLSVKYGLIGLEMEGSGVAEAVWQFGKSYLVVRGVSDYGDDRTKNDVWHSYAAASAAAYALALARRL